MQNQIRKIKITDPEYPNRFRQITNPPNQIYLLGKLPKPYFPVVAIVGARNPTPYGREMARKFAYVLSAHGVQIISGFARGIDKMAHEGALEAGKETFAVLGNGVDVCYPRENMKLYEKMKRQGGFMSEYDLKAEPLAWHFPQRNRLISALADKIVVVEAKAKSGSLITADFGLEQGKDVYAVPGRITDALSEGCNRLIVQGAAPALSPEELLKDLKVDISHKEKFYEKNKISLENEEKTVYSCIGLQPRHVDELLEETNLEISQLLSVLLQLELKGMIKEITKNYYIRA